jgi:hypothetical protein|tara:strand:- start:4 stop:165 length:162 start_codon:yes stop_codon:yes gene_type:complete
MLCHTNLSNFYRISFAMAQHHKYSINEIEEMLPYERDLYFDMIVDYIESQRAD